MWLLEMIVWPISLHVSMFQIQNPLFDLRYLKDMAIDQNPGT